MKTVDFHINAEAFVPARVQIYSLKNPHCTFILQSWSDEKVIDEVAKIIETELINSEISLSARMETACRKANDYIYSNFNQKNWTEFVELFIIVKQDNTYGSTLYWRSVGSIQAYLNSENKLRPLHVPGVFSLEEGGFSLPQTAIGLQPNENLLSEFGSTRISGLALPQVKVVLWSGASPDFVSWGLSLNQTAEFKRHLLHSAKEPAWVAVIEHLA